MIKDEMLFIDGLQLCKWDRELLLDMREGGINCIHASIGLWENARETLSNIGQWNRFFLDNEDLILQVKKGEDILRAKEEGKIGVILGMQNASLFEDELALVEIFNQLGLKIVQLTYNNQNLIGSSCYEENDPGLSRFGKNVIAEMNRVGMLIDLSHCGERTTLDAISVSSRPVAITHANPDWIYPAKRNKSREVLQALRDHDGILGLCLYPFLIGGPDTTLEEFCEMVARTVDFMGVERVAIGTDLTLNQDEQFLKWMRMGRWTFQVEYGAGSKDQPGWPPWPSWFQKPSDFGNIAEGLQRHGFHADEVEAIMGKNWLRFFTESFKSEKELSLCV